MIRISEELEHQYRVLQDKIDQLDCGACKPADVKKLSAPFGVYVERNGRYMARVRTLNGELIIEQLEDTVGIMNSNDISYVHFSSRRNMQLHGVPSKSVFSTLMDFGNRGMVFKGGGGNTFRGIAGSPYAGVSRTEVFDVTPYMEAVWGYIFSYEKAFTLGRKFKLAFSSDPSDEANCGVQDMGLLAVVKDEKRGFKVYAGGGLGRGAALGIELVDFIPAERALQCVVAAVDLFSDHGERQDRTKARLRFLRQKLGDDEFRNLFLEYLEKSDAPLLQDLEEVDYIEKAKSLAELNDPPLDSDAYRGWLARSVKETKFNDVVSVRLYIRKSIFSPDNLRTLAAMLRRIGAFCIRLTSQQDLIIPMVHKTALPLVYKTLTGPLSEQAVIDGSFSNHIISCIGAEVCSMGLINSPAIANEIAEVLDEMFCGYPDIRDEVYNDVIDGIRVSGCGSSCTANQIAAIGFNGHRKRIDGALTDIFFIHIGGSISEDGHYLAVSNPEWWIKTSQAAAFTAKIVKEYLDDYRAGNRRSLREFMLAKREAFLTKTAGTIRNMQ